MADKQHLVVLTGAGVSAESGLSTFRDAGGLWEGYDIMEVASPEGWDKDPETVLCFYNERRKAARQAQPNLAHRLLAQLEDYYEVTVITQNVDDLHERGGSSKVIHLHGRLDQCRSTANPNLIYDIEGDELNLGDTCELGSQLRPHIVWFGEMVPMFETAAAEAATADIFVIIGTSLVVYPASGLVHYVPRDKPKYIIDPNIPPVDTIPNLTKIPLPATSGTQQLFDMLTGLSK